MSKLTIEVLINAFKLPVSKATDYFKKKDVELSADWEKTAELIKRQSWSVSGVTKMRILTDTKNSLIKALERGESFQTWKKGLNEFYEQNGWFGKKGTNGKIGTVYQTNIQSAYNDGRFEQQQATKKILPYVQYLATLDSSTTTGCRNLNGKIFAKDDNLFNSDFRPPRHYNCRSRLRTVPNSVAKRLGLNDSKDFIEDKADKEFQGKKGTFSFKPKKENYEKKMFSDYEKEMKQQGF